VGRAVILNEEMNAACGIAGAMRDHSDEAPFAQKAMRHRNPVDSRGYARDDMGVGTQASPDSSAKPGGSATRDGCRQFLG
jgi:hypothetical protein